MVTSGYVHQSAVSFDTQRKNELFMQKLFNTCTI